MINTVEEIQRFWKPEQLNVTVEEFSAVCSSLDSDIRRRLVLMIGEDAVADAESSTPVDTKRLDAIKDAEFEFIHCAIIEKLWRDKAAGAERDIQLPNGTRITLQAFSGDDYEKILKTHIINAERALLEYA